MTVLQDKDTNEFIFPKWVVSFGCDENGNVFIKDVTGSTHYVPNSMEETSRILKRVYDGGDY